MKSEKREKKKENWQKLWKKFVEFLLRFSVSNGAKVWQSCRSRQMEENDYFIAKIGADTAENEQHFFFLATFCRNFDENRKLRSRGWAARWRAAVTRSCVRYYRTYWAGPPLSALRCPALPRADRLVFFLGVCVCILNSGKDLAKFRKNSGKISQNIANVWQN